MVTRFGGFAWLVVVALAVAPGCYTWRSASADRTVWDELPQDPRPELWIQGSPKVAAVFEGVYTAFGDVEPAPDERATQRYRRMFHDAHIFTRLVDARQGAGDGLCRVRLERSFHENEHSAENISKAVTVPGLLGYKFELVATLRLELDWPERDPVSYEARSVLTRVYHHSDRRDEARRIVYLEAERANSEAILHQLRANEDLFDRVVPLDDPSVSPL